MTTLYPTLDDLRGIVAELLEEEPGDLAEQANLFEAGLDSILLMRLVSGWRRSGIKIDFAELARTPTLEAWFALLSARTLAAAAEPLAEAAAPPAAAPEEGFPLGIMQHAYWVGRSAGHHLGGVAAHLYTEFDGAGVDPQRLRAALDALLARHESLRSRVTGDGRQVVLPPGPAPLTVHDLRGEPAERIDAHLDKTRDALSHQMLDIERGETFSAALTLLPEGRTRLHLDVDMVAADAVSYRILLADLARFYDEPAAEPLEVGYTYREYLAARAATRGEARHRAAEYWRERLTDLPGAPVLPLAAPARRAESAPRVARRHVHLPADTAAALADQARRRGLTTAMAMAAAFAEVVGHWSTVPRFLLNVPMFDRLPLHPDADKVVGDFSSSVLLDIDLSNPVAFAERARRVQERMHADAAHADHSGVEVLRDLTHRDGEQVLAPVVFTSALNLGELFASAVTERFGAPVWIVSQGPQVLLDAQLTEVGGGLLVNWDTREEAFAPGALDAMFAVFEGVVRRLAYDGAAWEEPVAVPSAQRERLLEGSEARIVDDHGRDRPDWVPGWVRTADGPSGLWARARPDGAVEPLGGEDEQALVGGVRVGAREVEAALLRDDRVAAAAAVPVEIEGAGRAFAAAIEVTEAGANPEEIRKELRLRAPGHLVPHRVAAVEELPRTGTGAVDTATVRALLTGPGAEAEAFVAPRTALEHVIASVWAEVLDLDRVGLTEEFIALGGDSVLAARVVARLREDLDTSAVGIRTLFGSPTVAALAERMRAADEGDRLEQVAEILCEIEELSDEEVAAELDSFGGADGAEEGR